MARNYDRPPSVSVFEETTASSNPLIATPDVLCLVGPANQVMKKTEVVAALTTTGTQLTKAGTDSSIKSILKVEDSDPTGAPTGYNTTTGYPSSSYTFNSTTNTISRVATAPTAIINNGSALSYSATSIPAIGNYSKFDGNGGTIIIESEEITYETITHSSETQTITISDATGGTFTLTFDGEETDAITYSATATTTATNIENALKDLTAIGDNDVTVEVDSGDFVVTFSGDLTGNVVQLTYDATNLTSGTTATIAITSVNGSFTFNSCVRGANNTTAAGHADGETITYSMVIIPNNRRVNVTYIYEPNDYYYPYAVTAYNFSSIVDRYGAAFKTSGEGAGVIVNSPITLAAKIAIENGASNFVIQPLFYSEDNIDDGPITSRRAPTNAESVSTTYTWSKTFQSLRDYENIGIIVPVVGQDTAYSFGSDGTATPASLGDTVQFQIAQLLQNHIAYIDNANDQLAIGVFGEDSTDSTDAAPLAARATLQTNINTLQNTSINSQTWNERFIYVSPTKFERPSDGGNSSVNAVLGGQYAAAAIGGMLSSRKASVSLTRKGVSGFKKVVDPRTKLEKTEDSGKGFFVIEQNKDGNIWVRHSLTTDVTSSATAEVSVVRAKHLMIDSVRQTIDNDIIGKIVADDNAPLIVQSAIGGTLRKLQDEGELVSFNSVQARIATVDPTVIEVRFNYRPAFPVNYVNIRFAIDLTSGTTVTTATAEQANIGA